MFKDFSSIGIESEVEQKKLTVTLPNTAYGCHWGILEKDQDFLNKEDLIELKDGYLVLQERGTVLKALYGLKSEIPRKMLELFSRGYEVSLNRALSELASFKGGKIAIFSCSGSLITFHNDEKIPCYAVDLDSMIAICRKYGFSLMVSGKVIPLDIFKNDEKKAIFFKTCELSGNGDSVVIELVKNE